MSRCASSVMFGFDFQENAAIVLMIENMEEMESLKVEGEEDIEIRLTDGTYVLSQAKSIVKASTDFDNVRAKAKKAMSSLSEAASRVKARELVYITNSSNPFNEELSKTMFIGPSRVKYDYLPETTKQLIDGWLAQIERPLDTSRLKIRVLPFETDDDEQRYKDVLQVISDFIGKINLSSVDGLRRQLHDVWLSMLDRNGTKSNKAVRLKKKDVVWPIIVFVTGRGRLDRNSLFCADLDDGEFEEIEHIYGKLIENYFERYDLVVKVITDFRDGGYTGRKRIESFIIDHWTDYVNELGLNSITDESVRSSLTKIVLYSMLTKRFDINKIKLALKL